MALTFGPKFSMRFKASFWNRVNNDVSEGDERLDTNLQAVEAEGSHERITKRLENSSEWGSCFNSFACFLYKLSARLAVLRKLCVQTKQNLEPNAPHKLISWGV